MATTATGVIENIHLVAEAGGTPQAVAEAEALPGLGLRGDRKVIAAEASGGGMVEPKKQLTLIEAEALEAVAREYDIAIPPGQSRRNVTTRGIALNHLVGTMFRVGTAIVRGVELCEPCGYLEKTSGLKGITRSLIHRGGLRCEVLHGGRLAVGDGVGERADAAIAEAAASGP